MPGQLQGRSFAPILQGEQQSGRISYSYNTIKFGCLPSSYAGIQTKEYLYLFNPWANGERKFATATTTATYRRMKELAIKDANIARRLQLFDYRELRNFIMSVMTQTFKKPYWYRATETDTSNERPVRGILVGNQ